jgi:phosphatidylglycerol:prolipoprotein diacylglycerol transferase
MFGYTPSPIIFQIGPFALRWYGLLIVTGVILGTYAAARLAQRQGYDPDHAWNVLLWLLGFGIVGARLQFVLSASLESAEMRQFYLSNPFNIIATWQGGLGIYGALIGGALGMALYCRRAGVPFWKLANFIFVGVPLGQAIGRWGNFFNQELYGQPTTLPWAVTIDPAHRLPGYEQYATFHPTFLYESLWSLIGFGILFWLVRRYGDRLLDGEVVGLYFVWYPLGRFLVEFVRLGSTYIGGLSPAQWLSLAAAAVALAITAARRARRRA